VPAEITTYCFYPGKIKDYLVANAIFRMGGAAVLMTNKPSLVKRCKYQLTHAVRVHTGQDDAAYRCGTRRRAQHQHMWCMQRRQQGAPHSCRVQRQQEVCNHDRGLVSARQYCSAS
jgi:hypothetical protein